MSIVITGVGLCLLAFIVHVAWWRRGRPRRSGQTLIVLMVCVILVGWLAAMLAASFGAGGLPRDLFGWLQALVLALALAAAYVMTYPALEVESPILFIIDAIARRGSQGFAIDEIRHRVDDSVLVAPRLQDLLDEGLVVLKDGRYVPTAKGVALVRIFVAWRRVLKAGLGG